MPGRDDALERVRLARLRQQLNADRTDQTLFRDWADSAFQGVMPSTGRSSLSDDERERREAALSAGFTGLIAAPLGFVAGEAIKSSLPEQSIEGAERQRALQNFVPNLDPSYFSSSAGGRARLRDSLGPVDQRSGLERELHIRRSSFAEHHGAHPGEVADHEAGAIAFGRGDGVPTPEDWAEAYKVVAEMQDEVPLNQVDWHRTAVHLGKSTPEHLMSVDQVPAFGSDLGGFSRNWNGPQEGNRVAYTVVPDVNANRFAQRLAPPLLDQVYRKDVIETSPVPGTTASKRRRGLEFASPSDEVIKPVPPQRMAELAGGERVALLNQLLPKQLEGTGQSGSAYLWGTQYQHPRYQEYGKGGANPEVVVSEVRTPPELETKYLFSGQTLDPYVAYKRGIDGESEQRGLGPSWGISSDDLPAGQAIAGPRQRRLTAGDISFRGDLIEKRGGFSLADAQATQQQLGLPVTAAHRRLPPEQALEQAVESIRVKEGFASHADVIDKYARRLPVLGSTTAPRRPAIARPGEFPLDVTPMIPAALKRGYDVGGALEEAGLPPTQGGLVRANTLVDQAVARRLKGVNRVTQLAPAAGIAAGFADPQAAELLGAAMRESGPMRTALAADALRVYGQNTVTGALQGAAVSGALAAAPRLGFAAVAAPVAAGLTVVAPALAMTGVAQAADSYLKGATGEGLARHVQKVQAKASPRGMEAVEQLLPAAKPVQARTSTGVAELKPWRPPSNPAEAIARETRKRLSLAGQRFNPLRGELGLSELLLGR